MSNWSNYQQKISSAFRGTVQELQNHYASIDVSFDAFNAKSVVQIQADLQLLTAESPFFQEYAKAIINYAKQMSLEFATPASISFYLLDKDKLHYQNLESSLSGEYADFSNLQAESHEVLAAFLHQTAIEEEGFSASFATMLVNSKSVSIWDRFILSFPTMKDIEAELLIKGIQDETAETTINSFRVLNTLSPDALADLIINFSETAGYKGIFTSSLINRAKVIVEQANGELSEEELENLYFEGFGDIERTAIQLVLDNGNIETINNLSTTDYGIFASLCDHNFFTTVAPYYLNNVAFVANTFAFQYRFIGRLLANTSESSPLSEWQVMVTDSNDNELGEVSLGSAITNGNGYFETYFFTFEELSSNYPLNFKLINPAGEQEEMEVAYFNFSSPSTPVDFVIDISEPVNSASIIAVNINDSNLSIPSELSNYLNANSLTTLEEIRKFGGLAYKDDLPSGTSDAATRLDSHANLELLKGAKEESVYLGENVALIDSGYENVFDIVREDRYTFVANTKAAFSGGQYAAGKTHEQSKSVVNYSNNLLTGGLANDFQDIPLDQELKHDLTSLIDKGCTCDDCKSGVSPLAYLADLLNYTIDHVKDDGNKIDLQDLQDLFKHPFADLPAECDSVNEKICQVRIVIEVLWSYLYNGSINDSNDLTTSVSNELKEIRLKTYELILVELGTSYEELRKVKTASTEERIELAKRIGIEESNLDSLILDHAGGAITDKKLEELFGYRDTARNYSDAATNQLPSALLMNDKPKINEYRESFIRNEFNLQDYPTKTFEQLGLPIIDPDVIGPDDFRNTDSTSNPFQLWQNRFDWISDTLNVLKGLKRKTNTLPKSQIIKVNGVSGALSPGLAVSLTDVDNLVHNFQVVASETQSDGTTVVTINGVPPLHIKDGTQAIIDNFTYDFENDTTSNLSAEDTVHKSIFKRMTEVFSYTKLDASTTNVTPWNGNTTQNDFENLYTNLRSGVNLQQTENDIQTDLSLNTDSFIRLYNLFEKDLKNRNIELAEPLSDEEWDEIFNIMLSAVKSKLITEWKNEESTLGIKLSTEDFFDSTNEPKIGTWPLISDGTNYVQSNNNPLIDPETINLSDLPNISTGTNAINLFNIRKGQLVTSKALIRSTREGGTTTNGFVDMVELVYGVTLSSEIQSTSTDLSAGNAVTKYAAEQKVVNEYFMNVESFLLLANAELKAAETDPAKQPSAEEWNALYTHLLTPYKIINLYEGINGWKQEEKDNYFLTENTTWKLRKVQLPKWRSSLKLRNAWKSELAQVSSQPTVDPYVIDLVNLHTLSSTDPIYQLWANRKQVIDSIKINFNTTLDSAAHIFQGLNSIYASALELSINYSGTPGAWVATEDELDAIALQREAGVNINERLVQLGLTYESFDRLYSLREMISVSSPPALTEDEKEDILNILTSIEKQKLFSVWNDEEAVLLIDLNSQTLGVPFSLSGDFFKIPEINSLQFSTNEIERSHYLYNSEAYLDWKRNLEGRIKIINSIHSSLKQMVSNAENETLIPTRDALIKHIMVLDSKTREEVDDWITRNLLIDSEMECCSPTTRVTQAIEALQTLLWGMNNQILMDEPELQNLSLNAPEFEEEWTSMGSYASWRAAMFVQLYPENILLPEFLNSNTVHFDELKQNVFNGKRTEKGIIDAADNYIENILSISKAVIKGAAIAEGRAFFYDSQNTSTVIEDFIIVVSKVVNHYEYLTVREDNKKMSILKLWQRIDVDESYEYIGHNYFKSGTSRRCVFAFYKTTGTNIEFVYRALNLTTGLWEESHTEWKLLNRPAIKVMMASNVSKNGKIEMMIKTMDSSNNGELLLRSIDPHTFGVIHDNVSYIKRDDGLFDKDSHYYFTIENGKYTFYRTEDSANTYIGPHEHLTVGNITRDVFTINNGSSILATLDHYILSSTNMLEGELNIQVIHNGTEESPLLFEWDGLGVHMMYQSFTTWSNGHQVHSYYGIDQSSAFGYNKYFTPMPLFSKTNEHYPNGELPLFLRHGILDVDLPHKSSFSYITVDSMSQGPSITGPEIPDPFYLKLYEQNPKPVIPELTDQRRGDVASSYTSQFQDKYLTYVRELYFFMPLIIARSLQNIGEYEKALNWYNVIYDQNNSDPKVSYELILDETRSSGFAIGEWLSDPLQPHNVAMNRNNAYTKYTILSMVQLLISYADHEFTQDNVESISRARQLYLEAIDLIERISQTDQCTANLLNFDITIGDPYLRAYWTTIKDQIHVLGDTSASNVGNLLINIQNTWEGAGTEESRLQQIELDVNQAITNVNSTNSIKDSLTSHRTKVVQVSNLLLSHKDTLITTQNVANNSGEHFRKSILSTTGFKEDTIKNQDIVMPWLEISGATMPDQNGKEDFFNENYVQDFVKPEGASSFGIIAEEQPEVAFRNIYKRSMTLTSAPVFNFCVPQNPLISAYEQKAQLNLHKIRTCRNIAGILRDVDPFVAPIDATTGLPSIGNTGVINIGGEYIYQASPYRYEFLIERSKEIIGLAQQLEGAFLSALEKLDNENYNLLRARQDLQTATANVRLQDLKILEARNGIKLSDLQINRAETHANGLSSMINAGLNSHEERLLGLYDDLYKYEKTAAIAGGVQSAIGSINTIAAYALLNPWAGVAAGVALNAAIVTGTSAQVNASKTSSRINSTSLFAAQDRREQEWGFQRSVALKDVIVAKQQMILAADRLRIVGQERNIADLQRLHTSVTLDFLASKFTNAELYEFMSGVLEQVYSYFLQEATAMAKLARKQLAFERQLNVPEFIKGDYWQAEKDGNYTVNPNDDSLDRKGITGSARLLEDIYRMDQYGVQSDSRKQNIRKTLSLATLSPSEFQQFKETGQLIFATDNDLFDRDYPGHYLRLIKKVSTSVIALIPPTDGIKATLSTIGLSRVVTGDTVFQTLNVNRSPETIALSSPYNDTGVFELATSNDRMLQPFEGTGVDTFWEFRMDKASNTGIDYNSIADILITIEYEALNSFDYKAEVVKKLNSGDQYKAMLPISFKTNLPDQWFDINNPDQTNSPFEVSFELNEQDFPVNVAQPVISDVLLYFPQSGNKKEITLDLFYEPNGSEIEIGGQDMVTSNFRISTADANGFVLNGIIGKSINGKWRLKLSDSSIIREMISEDKLSDILMVITFAGETPKYNL